MGTFRKSKTMGKPFRVGVPDLRRSVTCPIPGETRPLDAPNQPVLVLGSEEHCFYEKDQSSTRHDLMQDLADHDPTCDDAGHDDSLEEESDHGCCSPRIVASLSATACCG